MNHQLEIILEDNHLLVVNKPALLATMGVPEGETSLVSLARAYLKKKYNKPGNVFVGVVSRLDSFTTGTIALARTSKAASRLSAQIREGNMEKRYWALIHDADAPGEHGVLKHQIYKNDSARRMFAVDESNVPREFSPLAKNAELNFRTIAVARGMRLLEIELITGRKHQIRAQFAAAGCPVIGDRKYGSQQPFHRGIALHCRSLQFTHPTKKTTVQCDCLPPERWKLSSFGI